MRSESRRAGLAPDERDRLLKRAAVGDHAAEDSVVRSQLGMLVRLAEQRAGRGLSVEELVQEGTIGLIGAVRDYVDEGSDDFDGYSEHRVTAHMEAALSVEERAVEDARRMVEEAAAYDRVEMTLARELRRRPTGREIAEKLEWTEDRVGRVGELVEHARELHDEEILQYLEPEVFEPGNGSERREGAADR
jgi:RNA polymerase primary sigma factor